MIGFMEWFYRMLAEARCFDKEGFFQKFSFYGYLLLHFHQLEFQMALRKNGRVKQKFRLMANFCWRCRAVVHRYDSRWRFNKLVNRSVEVEG